jgi:hypothetical protein
MEEEIIEVKGIVAPDIVRRRQEWGGKECSFNLESGESVYCPYFIPHIRKRFIVKVIGKKSQYNKNGVVAEEVIFIGKALPLPKKQPKDQLKLREFIK